MMNVREGCSGLVTPQEAFYEVYGGSITVRRIGSSDCGCAAQTRENNEIWIYSSTSSAYIVNHPGIIVHELGHAFNNITGKSAQKVPGCLLRPYGDIIDHGNAENYYYEYASGARQFGYSTANPGSEEFADMFLGWVYQDFNTDSLSLGPQRSAYMNEYMSGYLSLMTP